MHQAVQLAKEPAGRTREQIMDAAREQVEAWQGTQTPDEVAVRIFEALHRKQVSKAQVAEQICALIAELPDTAESFRAKLPAYLVDAIDYVTISPEHTPAAGNQFTAQVVPESG